MSTYVMPSDNRWNVQIDGRRRAQVILEDNQVSAFRDHVAEVSGARVTVSLALNDEGKLVVEACNCEYAGHFDDHPLYDPALHEYGQAPAGSRRAWMVGPVCDKCADTHMAEYILAPDGPFQLD